MNIHIQTNECGRDSNQRRAQTNYDEHNHRLSVHQRGCGHSCSTVFHSLVFSTNFY